MPMHSFHHSDHDRKWRWPNVSSTMVRAASLPLPLSLFVLISIVWFNSGMGAEFQKCYVFKCGLIFLGFVVFFSHIRRSRVCRLPPLPLTISFCLFGMCACFVLVEFAVYIYTQYNIMRNCMRVDTYHNKYVRVYMYSYFCETVKMALLRWQDQRKFLRPESVYLIWIC